ncbi:MAG TPA: hypothetical protein PK295_01685 [Candidatus Magasanikbacteria bacterium]|nr:hypothetical protein [Candidatus Magasanikbacteria bacterium]
MARIKDFGIQKSALHEADMLLGEYEELLVEIRDLKKKAIRLYAEMERDQNKSKVVQTLGKILEIPE